MRTITFFSFKGGVGRTQAMLNAAYLLAQEGAYVVMLDMDVHAPGLSLMQQCQAHPGDERGGGIVDYIYHAMNPTSQEVPDLKHLAYQPQLIDKYVVKKTKKGKKHKREVDGDFKGDIKIIPCDDFSGSATALDEKMTFYRQRLDSIPFSQLNQLKRKNNQNQVLIEEIVKTIGDIPSEKLGDRLPDLLLIDSRTGFTEIGDLLLGEHTDHIVACFALNKQNRMGLDHFLQELMQNETRFPYNNLPSKITFLATLVPQGEETLKQQVLQEFRDVIQNRARADQFGDADVKERMPPIIEIPYHPLLALSEDVITKNHPDARPSEAYRKLKQRLDGQIIETERATARIEAENAEERTKVLTTEDSREPQPIPQHPSNLFHPYTRMPQWDWLCPKAKVSDIVGHNAADKNSWQKTLNQLCWLPGLKKSLKELFEDFQDLDNPEQLNMQGQILGKVFNNIQSDLLNLPSKHFNRLAYQTGEHFFNWCSFLIEKSLLQKDYSALAQAIQDPDRIASYPILHYPSFWEGFLESGYHVSQHALLIKVADTLFEQHHDHADLLLTLGRIYLIAQRPKKAFNALSQARDHFADQQRQDDLALTLIELGSAAYYRDLLSESRQFLAEALEITKKSKHHLYQGHVYKHFAYLEFRSDQLEKVPALIDKATNLYSKAKNHLGLVHLQNMQGELQMALQNWQKATTFFQNAFNQSSKINNKLGSINSRNGLAQVKLQQNDWEAARSAAQQALQVAKEIENPFSMAHARLILAEVERGLGNYPVSETQLHECLQAFQKINRSNGQIQTHMALARLYQAWQKHDAFAAALAEARHLAATKAWPLYTRLINREFGPPTE